MSNIKVFGHKTPDTDSVCSAIVFSWYMTEIKNTPATPFIPGNPNKETAFAIKKLGISTPEKIEVVNEGDKVAIVDTTNPDELIDGVENAEVIEIVDHHKLGGLKTSSPLNTTIRPVGCTSTVIYEILNAKNVTDIPKNIASLMITAIISDTLNLTGPTTTAEDKAAVSELNKVANLDLDSYAGELFTAKSDLTGMSARDILMADAKELDLAGKKILIGVHETTTVENAISMKSEILSEMNSVKAEKKYNGIFFFVVDILNAYAEAILVSEYEKQVIEKAFSVTANKTGDQATLPSIVSRKKQIIPALEKALN